MSTARLVFFNTIVAEIEVSQRCALRQHSYKTLCPSFAGANAADIEVRQRWVQLKDEHTSCAA